MNKTIFVAIMAMLTVSSYGQERRKDDNMPITDICKDISRRSASSNLEGYYLYYSPESLPIGFQRGKFGIFIELRAHMDRKLKTKKEAYSIKLENGTILKGSINVKNTYRRKKDGKWVYEFAYPYDHLDVLRNVRIMEFTLAETTFVNPEPDKLREYFNCISDLTYD